MHENEASKVDKNTVAERWSEYSGASHDFSDEMYWLALPSVMKRHQERACGRLPYLSWVEYCLNEFMPMLPARRMLSIGCGYGSLERQLHQLNAFQTCDAFDIAPMAIESAAKSAAAENMTNIIYRCADVEHIDLGTELYDAAWFSGSLHHISELELVLGRVKRSLKPDGVLFVNEYVGANHFGFPPAQLAAIDHAFHLIPDRYRRSFAPATRGQIVSVAPRPDPLEVRKADPSEAVRSSDILPVITQLFKVIAKNNCGGSILQFLLCGIAGNFREADPSSIAVLNMLLTIEDVLIDTGHLESDFVVLAARPR